MTKKQLTFKYISRAASKNPPRQECSWSPLVHRDGRPTLPLLLKKNGTTWGLHWQTMKNCTFSISAKPLVGMSERMDPAEEKQTRA
jgi:hypothetical protein